MESSPAPASHGSNSKQKPTLRNGVRVIGKIMAFAKSQKQSSTNTPQISMSREDDHFKVSFHNQTNGLKDTYRLDGCYDQDDSTSKLFAHEVKPLLQGLLHGENCCVISYGDQESGKSQLIQGSLETPGLAGMAFCEIFSSIDEVGGSIDISCYEMYNDHIYDLLEYKEKEIQVMEDTVGTIRLKGLSKIHVKSLSDFENFYFHTSDHRKFPQKAKNDAMAKSHKGLIMYITSVDEESKNSIVGKLNFMDLAGYEDVRKRVDARASIADCNKIKKSLYALLNVLRALNGDELYIPYRESKLTRLLQDFLCSTNSSMLITCLSPTLCPHTLRAFSMASKSCQFANREKQQCREHFLPCVPIDGIHSKKNTMKKLGTIGLESSRKISKENPLTYKGGTLYDTKVKQGLHNLGSNVTNIKQSLSMIKGSELNNTMQTKRNFGLGSSKTKIMDCSSTSKGRFSSHENAIKKATASPHYAKKTKLFNAAYPLSNTQKKENLYNKEGSIGFNDIPIFDELTEGSVGFKAISVSGGLKENAIISPKDVSEPTDHIQEGIGSSFAIDMNLSLNFEESKHSPTLTEQLRGLSNRFKDMISQPKFLIPASMEPKTPRPPLSSRVDNILLPEKYATSHEKFRTRSAGLKKSLVNECMDFLNSASKEELKQLKGIGEIRASYILELREKTSEPFKDIDDLMEMGLSSKQIKGLMSKILSDI